MTQGITQSRYSDSLIKWISLAVASVGMLAGFIVLLASNRVRLESVEATQSSNSLSIASTPASFTAVSPTAAAKLCFTRRDDWIYLKDFKTGTETRVVKGQWPNLSPDGKRLTFLSDATDPWQLKILNLTSREVLDFKSLQGRNVFSPQWSGDGTQIAFEMTDVNEARIGVLDVATGKWKGLTDKLGFEPNEGGVSLDSWVFGDHAVLFHSLSNLYEVDLNGNLLSKIPIDQFQISSRSRFSLSADRNFLLFDKTDDTPDRPLNDMVMIQDLSTRKLVTVTPATIEGSEPKWLPAGKAILFSCLKKSESPEHWSICSIGADGSDLKVLARDAQLVSFSVEH